MTKKNGRPYSEFWNNRERIKTILIAICEGKTREEIADMIGATRPAFMSWTERKGVSCNRIRHSKPDIDQMVESILQGRGV